MHPAVVLPAIEEAHNDLAESQAQHASMVAKLKPGQTILSFNPHVQTPGHASLPESASEFEFWKLSDEDALSTFMEGLAINLDMLELPAEEYERLPLGYAIARYVLRFETHCKFSAWLAIQNVGTEDMVLVRQYYERAGMPEEAKALALAEKAWYEAGGHEGDGYDAAGDAYASVENPNADEDERWFKLLDFLKSEAHWKQ